MNILKVPKKVINKYGAVSKECCISMVKNLSKISKANISVSITGIAGPNGGTKLKPVGLVYIGIKKGNKIILKKKNLNLKNVILFKMLSKRSFKRYFKYLINYTSLQLFFEKHQLFYLNQIGKI